MMKVVLRIESEAAMSHFGARVAARLRTGEAVCLWGLLGAGKSVLARGLIRALTSADEEVPSPTFTLVQAYQGRGLRVTHFDLYRLKRPEEAFELGLDEALDEGAAVVEWPERLDPAALPLDRLDIAIQATSDLGRRATLTGHGSWSARVGELAGQDG